MAWKAFINEVELLAQYPVMGLAIDDNSTPMPGYLYGEINAITYIDNGRNCRAIVGYLVSKLQSNLPRMCLKVLKLLIYLVKNGHREISDQVKFHEVPLKEAMGFSGPPDELHGYSAYENIRKLAKEVLEYVFVENREVSQNTSPPGSSKMPGYGSDASLKKLSGFGHTVKTPKTISDIVSGGISNFVEKLLPSDSKEKQSAIQTSYLNEKLPQYKPVTIEKTDDISFLSDQPKQNIQQQLPLVVPNNRRKTRVHKVGRAGGGWDESEDDIDTELMASADPSRDASISSDSLENSIKTDTQPGLEWADEHQIVEDFTVNEPLNKLCWTDIFSACKSCSSLNCDKILIFLIDKLENKEENVQLRTLVFIEYLLHHDVVLVESLAKIVLPALQKQAEHPKSSVQIKSRKLYLIIQNLNNNQQRISTGSGTPQKCGTAEIDHRDMTLLK